MRTCCICGTGWKTPREDILIYGCAFCRKGSNIVNTRNMPRNTKFEISPHLKGREIIARVNEKLKEWKCELQWKIN